MVDSNTAMLRQEADEFPSLAAIAGRRAYERALKSGLRVLIAEEGILYEVSSGGERRVVRRLAPQIPVQVGRIFKLW